ncbi:hypothetical protein [Nocardioides perillae]|uniref:Uncharacterized protein n=1 Tax=Nocardioides perillae TaxID=1119534 RepID=A0A7Y9ULS0_9ACTN|nr:hypothetical protein [Nocardioides perillae]NYG54611.1 hypothetical protein [Nocardioides perillae]
MNEPLSSGYRSAAAQPCTARMRENPVNTRTIAILALVIAVILLLVLLL